MCSVPCGCIPAILHSCSRSTDLKDKRNRELLWIKCLHTPYRFQKVQLTATVGKFSNNNAYGLVDDGNLCFEKESRTPICGTQVEEEGNAYFGLREHICEPRILVIRLQGCAKCRDLHGGTIVHATIIRLGLLQSNIYVGSTLVHFYAECGKLPKSQEVFDVLPVKDTAVWNALIAGYARHGHADKALDCFIEMQNHGCIPNAITFVCTVKACGAIGARDKGQGLHAEIVVRGLEKDSFTQHALLDMYAKVGLFLEAEEILDSFSIRDVLFWTALITGYVQHGYDKHALNCFEQMQIEGCFPSIVTFVILLKACGSLYDGCKGKELHSWIIKEGLLEEHVTLGNALVDMYAKCGLIAKAHAMFTTLPIWNVVSFNILIGAYAQQGHVEKAWMCYHWMQQVGFIPDSVSIILMLKVCGGPGTLNMGEQIYSQVIKEGWMERDITISNALVHMYIKCGLIMKAHQVFDKLPIRDVVSWNVIIAGSAHDRSVEAINFYDKMRVTGISPDAVTCVSVLYACGIIGAMDKAQGVHTMIINEEQLRHNSIIQNAIIDMYAKNGQLSKAEELFDSLPVHSLVSWSSLIAGYNQHGYPEEAVKCYEQMKCSGLSPNAVIFACILKAYGTMGAVDQGQVILTQLDREGLLNTDLIVSTAVVDMLVKCGLIVQAQEVFNNLGVKDAVLWNVFITGFALLGNVETVLHLVDQKIIGQGPMVDVVTFTIILNSCSHVGLLDEGQSCFDNIFTCYDIIPSLEHHNCMIDLVGRVGQLDKVISTFKKMPIFANAFTWATILGSCLKWNNIELGRQAFRNAMQLDREEAVAYVCMSNMYGHAACTTTPANLWLVQVCRGSDRGDQGA